VKVEQLIKYKNKIIRM